MTPEREERLRQAEEHGRRMAEATNAKMQQFVEEQEVMTKLIRDSEARLAKSEAEALARRRPRLVASNGARVDKRSPWDFG